MSLSKDDILIFSVILSPEFIEGSKDDILIFSVILSLSKDDILIFSVILSLSKDDIIASLSWFDKACPEYVSHFDMLSVTRIEGLTMTLGIVILSLSKGMSS